jgi:acyl carrier protein
MTSSSKPKLTRQQIHEVLWTVVAEHTGSEPSQLKPEHRLMHDLGADSLDVVEIVMELEERLGLTLPEDAANQSNLTLGEMEEELSRQCL